MVLAGDGAELTCNDQNLSSHRIHGAGIYANIGGILMVNVTIYYMDPMGYIIEHD